ncbi:MULTISPECIES: cytochrome P450 [Streptomyces]|uniref:Cytochrome P450 n=2 Tax=Streptomyces rimosus subsp. rimosus TaxID=132474 RepID=L8ESL9_STRR1|nr:MULTISPECIES: cytochrome P450 [Streptomyces]KOG78258.1 cytochrome P450 [Kitasatospora aureofaciens]MYT42898.1 cytochrome P450 [Streptomyces sp. SID5471]KEF08775.1 cytochrome P450 [Streptomyces rimosus]KOT37919.1 cytochrome P450 [Streptomyces rimosus subsp. rimosus]KOT46029.1 cytochrome P450 [Streptomyces sp. NRRL WC-3701]
MGTHIPGPEPRPDGGVDAVAAAGGLHRYQLWLHAEYGPVVRFQLPGAETAVSVADPVLLEATAHIDKRPERLFEFLAPLCEAGNLQVLPAEEHTPWRRVLLSVLAGRPSHERHFERFTELTTSLADRWAGQGEQEPVALQKELTALSLRMIGAYALGGDAADPEKVIAAFEEVLTEYLGRLYQVPVPGTEEERARRAEQALAYLRATVDRVLTAHRPDSRTDRSDLIGALVAAGEDPARIRDTVMVAMLAAHHTTGVAVSWTLHLLGRHPEVAERVAGELDRVLGDRAVPGYADLRRLTYLDMVLKESMRLFPPGPYGARETTEALVLGAYEVPAGTVIFYPFWAVHLNPDHWPEPERFVPERFLPEEVAKRPRLAYIPFGLGPRSCEGAGLATVEAQLVLAVLLKRFRFRPVPGHEVTPIERFVLWAADDIRMFVSRREVGAGSP